MRRVEREFGQKSFAARVAGRDLRKLYEVALADGGILVDALEMRGVPAADEIEFGGPARRDVGMLAEEARTNRVKRSRPDDRLSHCLHTSHHLGGSAPREGQQHDTTRIGAIDDEMSNAMGKGVGLPRA